MGKGLATSKKSMAKCYKCQKEPVAEEFQRCPTCEKDHQELCKELDSRPLKQVERVKEELFPIKSVKQGIEVTTFISREDAANMGVKLPT